MKLLIISVAAAVGLLVAVTKLASRDHTPSRQSGVLEQEACRHCMTCKAAAAQKSSRLTNLMIGHWSFRGNQSANEKVTLAAAA
jgi:hypothetical protein